MRSWQWAWWHQKSARPAWQTARQAASGRCGWGVARTTLQTAAHGTCGRWALCYTLPPACAALLHTHPNSMFFCAGPLPCGGPGCGPPGAGRHLRAVQSTRGRRQVRVLGLGVGCRLGMGRTTADAPKRGMGAHCAACSSKAGCQDSGLALHLLHVSSPLAQPLLPPLLCAAAQS